MIVEPMSIEEFRRRYGELDTSHALSHFTPPVDTQIVVTLLNFAKPRRILEIGTALGHMTANLANWSMPSAVVFSIGTVRELAVPVSDAQQAEVPPRSKLGRFANTFGNVQKVLFAVADSTTYDFRRIAPIDFAYIDGSHEFEHVLADTQAVYDVLKPGGVVVWHDFGNEPAVPGVEGAIRELRFPETVVHILGSWVAFSRKRVTEATMMP